MCSPGILSEPPNWPAWVTLTLVKKAKGTFSGGGVSGLNVTGMRPKRLPFSSSVYIVTVPWRMVDLEPFRASTWAVVPAGPTVFW